MSFSRRKFIAGGASAVAAGALIPGQGFASAIGRENSSASSNELMVELGKRAVQAAIDSGASYTDARLTTTTSLSGAMLRSEDLNFCIRTLVNGYWGFATTPVYSFDEASRLGSDAVNQAKTYSQAISRKAELAPIVGKESGSWTMPVEIDPFEIPTEEIWDLGVGIQLFIQRLKFYNNHGYTSLFIRQDKAFVSSENQQCTQRLYRSVGSMNFSLTDGETGRGAGRAFPVMGPVGMGFEHLRNRDLRGMVKEAHEDALKDMKLPVVPVEPGKFNILFDSVTIGRILGHGLGRATELDRAMGYEANSSGTSFITDPSSMLGELKIGYGKLNVVANMMIPGAVGFTKWDDEGIAPIPVKLVESGMLAGMQTSRESVSWIADSLQRRGMPVTSTGCAFAGDATTLPLIAAADIELQAGETSETIDSLRSGIDRGIEFRDAQVQFDFQSSTAFLFGSAYTIKGGKRVDVIVNAGVLFKTSEFWNNIIATGGAGSAERYGHEFTKGQPAESKFQSVSAVPMIVGDLALIDITRKA